MENSSNMRINCCEITRKRKRYDSVLLQKPLHPPKTPKRKVTILKRHQKSYKWTIMERLRTVSLRNDLQRTGVVKPVYVILTFLQNAQLCNQKSTHLKIVNNPPYTDRGPIASQSREAKNHFTNIWSNKNSISKNVKTSARAGYALPVWKRAQIQGQKECRLKQSKGRGSGLCLF